MLKKNSLFIVLLGIFSFAQGQPPGENPFSFEASYIGDAYGNAAGGLKTGTGYMGMGNMIMGFDTEKAGWWKGGSFRINGAATHGKSLTENYLGDLQVASNIDAGDHVYMHELWFKQEFEQFSFTIGLQDLNAEFMASENAGEFVNSSFGMPPVMAINVPVPIFPLTGLGISARWDINERLAWQSVFFDGYQTPFEENNPYNLHWDFGKDDGLLAATEFHSKFNIKGKEGTYKIGAYYHSGVKDFNEDTQTDETVFEKNYGFYLMADQTVFERGFRTISLFTQFAIAPESKNANNYYFGFGGNLFGVFSKQQKDALGLAVAHAGLHDTSHNHETTLELYYKYQLTDNIAIQPDIQYIIDPSGTDQNLSNALAGILRLHINF